MAPAGVNTERAEFENPKVWDWLKSCSDDVIRGADGHDYMSLARVLNNNDITRLSDVLELEQRDYEAMCQMDSLPFSLGLVKRVMQYAKVDAQLLSAKMH